MTNALTTIPQTGLATQTGETAASSVAAQAKASIEARWTVAIAQPRNLETVRQEILRECARPSFAAVGRYRKPIGQGVEGLSIRFVEAALQAMGNVDTEAITIYDDEQKRIVEVRVTDFQKNVCHRKQITISKLVERRSLRQGQSALGSRTNSTGQTVYIVAASEDDLLNKEGALVSKAIRTCGLRIIPGWLQDESEQAIVATARNEAARDPDAERRKLLDGFGQFGVTPTELERYLGHPIAQIVPAELVDLRAVWTTISAGEATWADTLMHRLEERGDAQATEATEAPKGEAKAAPSSGQGTAAVKEALAALAKRSAPPAVAPAQADAQAKLDAERAQVKADVEARATEETEQAKRPSKSKAAIAERKAEMEEIGRPNIYDGKAANLYVSYGDPRNKAKALLKPSTPTVAEKTEAQIEAEAKAAAEKARAESESESTPHDPTTGEVAEGHQIEGDPDEPDWMTEGDDTPPKGEGF